MKPLKTSILILTGALLCIFSCVKKTKESTFKNQDKEVLEKVTANSDTLKIGYTYWWPQSGPFIGHCGEPYSLVFLGTVLDIKKENSTSNYTSKIGTTSIDQVLFVKNVKNNSFKKQQYFVSDCFANINLAKEDKVIVFCYSYEDSYSIPGGKSILKISGINDPVVGSIKKYIQSNQNPLVIKQDSTLWKEQKLDSELKQIIACKETFL
ncbi:hypothetical protein [Aquimarina sp. 2201CG5-10]|uniref:hypothetical protein n=1 Tax=Aquimarina callyspongiae TaxID=3098150 RepID=UPI002AB3A812|nr:hypothetical protein [Aquimarina sp. 2201CG5-10]MDY8135103.1 hypothetical protein [Aquimarina sp. 2201CG5-10]